MILGRISEVEIEYDEENDALFLIKCDNPYEINLIGIWDTNEARELINFLNKFIEMKEK